MITTPFVDIQKRHPTLFDAAILLFYVALVYVWFAWAPLVASDYAALKHTDGRIWAMERHLFGERVEFYRLANIAALYICTLFAYFITNRVLRDRAWLGRLAGVLFMANMVHTEAVMRIDGLAGYLGEAILFLGLFSAYLAGRAKMAKVRHPVSILLWILVICVVYSAANRILFGSWGINLVPIVLLYEWGVAREHLNWPSGKWGVAAVAGIAFLPVLTLVSVLLVLRELDRTVAEWLIDRMWNVGSLYFIFYFIGFLPDTLNGMAQLGNHESSVGAMPAIWIAGILGWATVVGIVALICRKANRRTIIFGLLAILVLAVVRKPFRIDPFTLQNGGKLLVECVFYTLALVALFRRMMDHPRWRRPLVVMTTLLCIFFMGMQVRANVLWWQAAERVGSTGAPANVINEPRVDQESN